MATIHSYNSAEICTKCGASIASVEAFGFECHCSTGTIAPNRWFRLTLREYVDWLGDLPLPLQQQRKHFADFVGHARSWYKHLSGGGPGVDFHFFIDKYTAHDRVRPTSTPVMRERSSRGNHYSVLSTQAHFRRFGPLRYFGRSERPKYRTTNEATPLWLPNEILVAGTAKLTSMIHTHSANPRILLRLVDWPEESGGREMLSKIFKRCRR